MATKETFTRGMAALAMNFNREITSELVELYWAILQELTDEELDRAFQTSMRKDEFWPPTARLLRYARTPVPAKASGALVFQEIVDSYFRGRHLDPRQIAQVYGNEARAAFIAAGGVIAFKNCGTEASAQWVRKSFLEAWEEMAEAGAPMDAPMLTDGEASGVLAQVEDMIAKKMP